MISESFKLPAHTISESLHAGSFCFPVVYFEVVLIDELVPPKPHFAGRPSSPCNWRSTMLKSREKGRLDSVQGEGPPRLSPGRRAASTQSREKGRLVSVQGEGPPRLSPGRRAASTPVRETTSTHKPHFIRHWTCSFCLVSAISAFIGRFWQENAAGAVHVAKNHGPGVVSR
jgi:hypothetical protein